MLVLAVGAPVEVELALDIALPGRLTLLAAARRVEVGAAVRFGAASVPLAVVVARAVDVVVGLAVATRVEACVGAAEATLRLDTAVRAVETVARDDMEEAEEPDDVEDTLPA